MSIFFVQAGTGGLIKIGYTDDVVGRLSILRSDSPVDLRLLLAIDGDMAKKHELQRSFASHLRRGDWYDPAEEILLFIQAHKCEHRVTRRVRVKGERTRSSIIRDKRDMMIIDKLKEMDAYIAPVDLYRLSDALNRNYNTVYYWLYGDKSKGIEGLVDRNKFISIEEIDGGRHTKNRIAVRLLPPPV